MVLAGARVFTGGDPIALRRQGSRPALFEYPSKPIGNRMSLLAEACRAGHLPNWIPRRRLGLMSSPIRVMLDSPAKGPPDHATGSTNAPSGSDTSGSGYRNRLQ